MPEPAPLPTALLGRPFTTAQARQHGVSAERLRRSDLSHPFHRVHVDRELDLDETCRAFLLVGESATQVSSPGTSSSGAPSRRRFGETADSPRALAFSHVTAALLHRFPLPGALERWTGIDVAAVWPRTAPSGRGVRGHALRPGSVEVEVRHGLPVVSAADVWCQLAPMLTREDLVAVADFILSGDAWAGGSRVPLASRGDLESARVRARGKRGSATLDWALAHARERVDSRPESHLRLLLVGAGLPEPLCGDPTPVDGGVLRPDLKLPHERVVLEYEGDGHRSDARRWRADIIRRERFEAAGWRVIRVTADDLYVHPEAFLARVRTVLALASPGGSSSAPGRGRRFAETRRP